MTVAIYFEIDEELKRRFNIVLAERGEMKTKVLTNMILKYVEEHKNGWGND